MGLDLKLVLQVHYGRGMLGMLSLCHTLFLAMRIFSTGCYDLTNVNIELINCLNIFPYTCSAMNMLTNVHEPMIEQIKITFEYIVSLVGVEMHQRCVNLMHDWAPQ